MAQNGLQKYEVRIRNLQTHSEQQSKVLKRKTEEVKISFNMDTNADLGVLISVVVLYTFLSSWDP